MSNNTLKDKILLLVNKMTGDKEKDIVIVKNEVPTIFKDQEDLSVLHILLNELYPEDKCMSLVYALIDCGADINCSLDKYYGSFIQTAIVAGYSDEFVQDILSYALYMGLDPNIVCTGEYSDENLFKCTGSSNNTIMHTAAYAKRFGGTIKNMYGMLINAGYDFRYKNSNGETAFEAYSRHMLASEETMEELQEMYDLEISYSEKETDDEKRALGYEATLNNLIELIPFMTGDIDEDEALVSEAMDIDWRGPCGQSLLHILFDEKHGDLEKTKYLAFALISSGIDLNLRSADYEGTFINTAIASEYPDSVIIDLLKEACRFGFDINAKNDDEDTILHTAIAFIAEEPVISISKLARACAELGFDFSQVDKIGENVLESYCSIRGEDQNFKSEFNLLSDIFKEYAGEKINEQRSTRRAPKPLSSFGVVLTDKEYKTEPIVGREKELRDLEIGLAQKKKSPIIVGESGVGKTALVEELAYKITTGDVKGYLKDKKILKISPTSLVAGQKYVGDFELKIQELVESCMANDCILFIDEIHTMFGVGTTDKSDNDMVKNIMPYLEDLKIIGTTTKSEYDRYISGNPLSRRFLPIKIEELSREKLELVVKKCIKDYGEEYGISCESILKTNISEVLLDATSKEHRSYFDRVNNPDLVISIVDRAYAYALYDESNEINTDHFKSAINDCTRIGLTARENASIDLDNISPVEDSKCLILQFNNYLK